MDQIIKVPVRGSADGCVRVSESMHVLTTHLGVFDPADGRTAVVSIQGADALLEIAAALVERAKQVTADERVLKGV